MNIPSFNDRERAAENDYIRQKELEKAKARAAQKAQQPQTKDAGTSASGTGTGSINTKGQEGNPAAK